MMWINDLKKRINAESIQANKSKPLAFGEKHFAFMLMLYVPKRASQSENMLRHEQIHLIYQITWQ